jgi:hypothetical protein
MLIKYPPGPAKCEERKTELAAVSVDTQKANPLINQVTKGMVSIIYVRERKLRWL